MLGVVVGTGAWVSSETIVVEGVGVLGTVVGLCSSAGVVWVFGSVMINGWGVGVGIGVGSVIGGGRVEMTVPVVSEVSPSDPHPDRNRLQASTKLAM